MAVKDATCVIHRPEKRVQEGGFLELLAGETGVEAVAGVQLRKRKWIKMRVQVLAYIVNETSDPAKDHVTTFPLLEFEISLGTEEQN